jgi:uncharacterized membrane protein YeaQ/YmgE (transglycosylase-associated protein family)
MLFRFARKTASLTVSPERKCSGWKLEGEIMGLLWWIIVGVIAGWATGKIMKGSGYGFIADTLLGIVGAVVGGYVAGALGISPVGGMIYTILIAIIGAVIVVFLFRLITGKRA